MSETIPPFRTHPALVRVLVGMHRQLRSSRIDALLCSRRQNREEELARERAREFLRLVGLNDRDDELARNLPYGDQRRLELARALACEPALLPIDEPTAGMNPRETADMEARIDPRRTEPSPTARRVEHARRVVGGSRGGGRGYRGRKGLH